MLRRLPGSSAARRAAYLTILASTLTTAPVAAQTREPAGIPRFPIEGGALSLEGPARPGVYISDAGRRAAVFGDESGALEVWTWPLKLVRDLELAFRIPDYDAPIPAAKVAKRVVARPEGFSIVYSHATFTVTEHVIVPLEEPGVLVLLEVETVRPLDIQVRMNADFNLAWPGSFGGGYITWDAEHRWFLLSQGGLRQYNAVVGSPFAIEGTSHPAHDAPMVPSQFILRFSPERSVSDFIPIVIAGGATPARDSIYAVYDRLLRNAPRYWEEKVAHYRDVRRGQLSISTPVRSLDRALEWAKANLDQQLVCNPDLGCGLVAGFGRAGAGNFRPGFGWYFGGDAAINSLAMDVIGQQPLVKTGLEFLAGLQRADGKIPHEISHAAKRLPWFTDYPYTWFHGDTTPFWITACYEYWRASGDSDFLHRLWPKIRLAYDWSRKADTDGDGLMENPVAGAGAIEVGGLGENLHTDIYLAGIWTASLEGVAEMARAMGEPAVAAQADSTFRLASRSLESRFWLEPAGIYAFALLEGGGSAAKGSAAVAGAAGLRINDALTVWPSTAMAFGLLEPARADRMLQAIGSAELTSDWGPRMLSWKHPLYEPLHYNNGAVWPFVTGFAALAHYRYHRGWAGYDLVRDVARTTFDFARGHNPELISGHFYQVLDTAVPDQFFATSMLVTPLVRGLIGFEPDAPNHAAALEPHLPAEWDSATVRGLRVGTTTFDMEIHRDAESYSVALRRTGGSEPLEIRLSPALPLGARVGSVTVNERDLPLQVEETAHDVHPVAEVTLRDEVEAAFEFRGGVEMLAHPEEVVPGSVSEAPRILDFRRQGRDYLVVVEGLAGRSYPITVRSSARLKDVRGARLEDAGDDRRVLNVAIPAGTGYRRVEVRFGS